jgi:hypothetical protein
MSNRFEVGSWSGTGANLSEGFFQPQSGVGLTSPAGVGLLLFGAVAVVGLGLTSSAGVGLLLGAVVVVGLGLTSSAAGVGLLLGAAVVVGLGLTSSAGVGLLCGVVVVVGFWTNLGVGRPFPLILKLQSEFRSCRSFEIFLYSFLKLSP